MPSGCPHHPRRLAALVFAALLLEACGPSAGHGVSCTPDSAEALCGSAARSCGELTTTDACGAARTVTCGDCAAGERCDQAAGACVPCSAESDAEFCRRLGRGCGPWTAADACGQPRTADCGGCPAPWSCDAAAGLCLCESESDREFCGNTMCGSARGLDRCGRPRDVAECGPCPATEICLQGACVLCTPESDEELCRAQHRECGSAFGIDSCGVPRGMASCGECVAPQVCDPNGTCRMAGEDCDFAGAIPLGPSGRGTVRGDLSAPEASTQGSCGNTQGPDLVYAVTLDSEKVLEAVLAPDAPSAGFIPALYLRWACDQPDTEVVCSSQNLEGPVKLVARLAAGTWFLWADTNAAGMGGFTLTVAATDPQPPPSNERCAAALPIALPALPGAVSLQGTTLGAADDSQDFCGGASGPDVVYTVLLDRVADLTVDLHPVDWNTVLYVRSGCADSASTADSIACRDLAGPGGNESVTLRSAAPGLYSIWVDSPRRFDAGTFALELTVRAPTVATNDACASPEPLDFAATTHVSLSADTSGATDDTSGTCATSDGPDVVYGLHLDHDASVTVAVTAASGSLFQPAVYLRRDCAQAATELACARPRSGRAAASVPHLTPGDYSIVVDGLDGTSGAFTLDVDLDAPTINDRCDNPQLLVFDGSGMATAHGDTRPAQNNLAGRCAERSLGRDVVYTFTTRVLSSIEVEVAPSPASALAPMVYLRSECGSGPTETGCARAEVGQPAQLAVSRLRADVWHLVVDSSDPASAGPFELTVRQAAPPPTPANDTCANYELLAFGPNDSVRVQRTTAGAAADYGASCGGGDGADLAFAFDLGAPSAVRAELTTTPGVEPVVYVRSACASWAAADELGCTRGWNARAALVTPTLPAGRYYLIVDSAYPADGAFTLDLAKVAPLPLDCATAQVLSVTPGQATVVQGDTAPARNSSASVGCAPSDGRDLVYTFVTRRTLNLRARLAWNEPLRVGQLYLQSVCGAAETACATAAGGAQETDLYARALPAGSWWLRVDGAYASIADEGPFTLELTLTDAPAAPANDRCADAAPLTFVNGVATATADLGGASDDSSGSCGGLGGPDAVYSLVVPGPGAKSLRAQVISTPTPGFEPVLYLRSSCTGSEIACGSGAQVAALGVESLAPGTWYLFVDGRRAPGGPIAIEVALGAPATLPDACASAAALVPNATNHLVLRGDTASAIDDTKSLGCSDGFGPDLVYQLDTTGLGQRDLLATLALDDPSNTPVLYLRTACPARSAADEIACDVPPAPGPAALVRRGLAPGVYYLWVDSLWWGDLFTLDLQLPPTQAAPANDGCAGAIPLALGGGAATVGGALTWAHDDARGTCGGAGGRDVAYTFSTGQTQRLTARVTADAGTFSPRVYVRQSCASAVASDEITCAVPVGDPRRATAIVNALPAGNYALWVDASDAAGEGSFALEVALDAPVTGPANESCASAASLGMLAAGSSRMFSGTTAAAQSESDGACTAPGAADVLYRFELGQAQRVIASVLPWSAQYEPAIRLRATACDASAERCTAAPSAGSAAIAWEENAAAGSWFLWVDGGGAQSLATAGSFLLEIDLADPNAAPANDGCAGAVAMVHGTPSIGATIGATNDFPGPLPQACRGLAVPGRDVVYQYAPTASGPFEVVVTPAAGSFAPVVWVSASSCGPAACIAAADYPDWDDAYRVSIAGAAGTSYTIVVDSGAWAAYGPFEIVVR